MNLGELIQERFKALGWSNYRVAKEFMAVRQETGDAARKYDTAVRRAIANPQGASLKTICDLVTALGGEVVIRFPDDPDGGGGE